MQEIQKKSNRVLWVFIGLAALCLTLGTLGWSSVFGDMSEEDRYEQFQSDSLSHAEVLELKQELREKNEMRKLDLQEQSTIHNEKRDSLWESSYQFFLRLSLEDSNNTGNFLIIKDTSTETKIFILSQKGSGEKYYLTKTIQEYRRKFPDRQHPHEVFKIAHAVMDDMTID